MRSIVAAAIVLLLLTPPRVLAQTAAPASPGGPAGGAAAAKSPISDIFGVDLATRQNPGGTTANPSTIALTGVGWIRITADWSVIEPTQGKFDWTELDTPVRRSADAGAHIVVLLQNTPKWAALTPDTPAVVWSHQPPRRIADWTAFVSAVVTRYRGRVGAWQVEPSLDLAVYRGTNADYRDLLHAARVAVRRADPKALVVAASPGGLDLSFLKTMRTRAGDDFDAVMLFPRGRSAADLLEALSVIRSRILTDGRHQLWLSALPAWGPEGQLAAAALAGGAGRQFWPALDPSLTTAMRFLGGARFIGPLNRGPGVYAFVFANGASNVVVAWSTGGTRSVPLATNGALAAVGAGGQVLPPVGGDGAGITVGADPVYVSNPAQSVVDEAVRTAQQGPYAVPREPDFSKADSVSATLGSTNVEHGLYNQRLRALPSGGLVPVTVDGSEAVRTDQPKDAVYAYFDIDHSYVFYADGRYDLLITIEVHKASGPDRVGFNLLYDSMSGYKFTSWQWVEAGKDWATYTFRLTDAGFSSTWGWDFAVNGAGDKKEDLVIRSVTVKKVLPSAP